MRKPDVYRVYKGEEKRRFLKVRKAIDEDDFGERKLWIKMARMLGPDKLAELENGLKGDKYSDGAIEKYAAEMVRGSRICRTTGILVEHLRLSAERLPKGVLERKLTGAEGGILPVLPKKTVKSLAALQVVTIGDFVLKTRQELEGLGMSRKDIDRISNGLFYYGIRTVDNPPSRT
ncbi:MAG: hypothetical protein V1861_03585 [Candidatus Micrarchaeota archaeon]